MRKTLIALGIATTALLALPVHAQEAPWNSPCGSWNTWSEEPFDHMVNRLNCETARHPVDLNALKADAARRDAIDAAKLANTPWPHNAPASTKITTLVATFNALEPRLLLSTITPQSKDALDLLVHQAIIDPDLKPAALNLCEWLEQHGYARLDLPLQCPIP